MDKRELTELVERSQTGDAQARERLAEAVQSRVYFYCLKTLKNPDDAQDAVQDSLLNMLTSLNSLRQPEYFWTWLTRIVIRACHRHRTQKLREAQRLEMAGALQAFSWSLDDRQRPDRLLDSEEDRRMLVELMDSLSESQRRCVQMFYYREMSTKDIARAMGTSEGAVKSRLYYARQTIKRVYTS